MSSFRVSASSVGCNELKGFAAFMAGKASAVFGRRPV